MILHKDMASFTAAIQTASERLKIPPVFVEKDYWITWVLKRLSQSKFNDNVVFKGGTSLSKAYKLIDRFSEDIDIAVLNVPGLSGNQVKNLIRDVEKDISVDLSEIHEHLGTSKGSRFRKSYYTYPKTGDNRFYQGVSNKLIIEINSFANPIPFEQREIFSLIGTSLSMNNQNSLIEKYELMPFTVNVLEKNQTLLEKLVSLFRVSFEADVVSGISGKIRHFYDLFYLLNDNNCKAFVDSRDFPVQFSDVWNHDQEAFDEPHSWKNKSVLESPLFLQFPDFWEAVKPTYKRELSALAYTEIPSENKIAEAFIYIMKKLHP
ncbi:MAG TPA: nucleotidyl transferase AbiEii/AbiGii toxin family protein [Bacteroidales bacterium]|nr:nucleotidyl transferase AbiEii/AbiGii toxin family protein [Bacteroidales bacterium]